MVKSHILIAAALFVGACGLTAEPIASESPTPAIAGPSSPSQSPPSAVATKPALPPEVIASAERAVARFADVLARPDYAALRSFITRAGWVAGFYRSEGLPPKNRSQTIDTLRKTWSDGRLRIAVEQRPLLLAGRFLPPGNLYVRSTWSEHSGVSPHVWLTLRYEGGEWFWSGALFNVPTATATAEPDSRPRCDPEGAFGDLEGTATAPATLETWQREANSGADAARLSPEWVGFKYAEQAGLVTGLESTALVWHEPDTAWLALCSARTKVRIELFRAFPSQEESVWGARGHRWLKP